MLGNGCRERQEWWLFSLGVVLVGSCLGIESGI